MTGADLVVVLLFALAGLLIGGTISLWPTNRLAAGIVAALAVLAAGGAVLRLLPG
jgi:uncharacterized membrane protein YqjE